MTSWRLLIDDGAGAADGLATDEALMLAYGRDQASGSGSPVSRGPSGEPATPATLHLYTYRPHCALVGRYQVLDAEVDREACETLGLGVGRRPTGGGAIIMGPGQLGVAVTTRAPTDVSPRTLLRDYATGIVAGLARIGIDTSFRGKNDLEVGGRKIAGLGLYVDDRGALLFHASVLADLDVELMLQVLRIPGAKLSDKGVERVHERITTVGRELGRPTMAADIRVAIAEGFRDTLGLEFVSSTLASHELDRADQLVRERYADPAWLQGRTLTGDARGTEMVKTPFGLLRAYVGIQGTSLSSVLIAGDMSVMPPELVRLEQALRWCRADPERIAEIVARELQGTDTEIDPGDLASAIWNATERALERSQGAVPVRPEGSCYFPAAEAAAPTHASEVPS